MNGFSQFLAFACAARHGSFAHAGRELGVTPSTVAKRIARLEAQLGVRLFHRTTRQIALTSEGVTLYARCQQILADIGDLERLAAGTGGEPRGELRLNVPITYGKRVILPVLANVLHQYPAMTADVRFSDQVCDLVGDGLDAAVRIMPLADSRLTSRQVDEQRLVLCASDDYLNRCGQPCEPSQLEGHSFIVFRSPTSGRERPVQFGVGGQMLELHPVHRMLLDDGEGMVQAACLGMGLAQVPDYIAAQELARGTLRELMPAFRPPPLPIQIVWQGSRLLPARVRVMIDALARHRRGAPPEPDA